MKKMLKAPAAKGVRKKSAKIVNLQADPAVIESVQQKIRERAYEHFLERGCEAGHHEDDWIRAEKEILAGMRN
jgi:hypothetical protein